MSEIVTEHGESAKGRLEKLLAMKGAGTRLYGPRTVEEIDAEIREFRGDGLRVVQRLDL